MSKKGLRIFYICLTVVVLILLFLVSNIYAKDTKKIFIVHSYNSEYKWIKEYKLGLNDGFKKYGLDKFKLIIKEYYMDAKRYPDLLKNKGVQAYNLYRTFKPDLVIAADDAAQKFFVVPYLSNKVKTPVVFLGVNADPSVYGYPSNNVTGVIEKINYKESLVLLHLLSPTVKSYGIISDKSISAGVVLKKLEYLNKSINFIQLKKVYVTNDFEKWKKYVLKLQYEVDAIFVFSYFTLKDKEGNYIEPKKVLNWYLKNSKIPEVTPLLFAVKDGLLCSYGESSYIQGMDAAKIIFEILSYGKNIKDIPIVSSRRGLRAINTKRARQLVIEIPADLIPGTVFYD